MQRWANAAYINSEPKTRVINPHPQPVAIFGSSDLWGDGVVLFASSETDSTHPGKMDGAVGAAKRTLRVLENVMV